MLKSDLTSMTVYTHKSLTTTSIFAGDGCAPSLLTTMPTKFGCGAHHIDLTRFPTTRTGGATPSPRALLALSLIHI